MNFTIALRSSLVRLRKFSTVYRASLLALPCHMIASKGMSNKEVADALNLSVHTVTTHRRNISNKLQIHSPAGITIYAIVNRLLNLHEIRKMQ